MFNRMILLSSLVATMIILVMMNFTTPTSIGPLGVLVIFTMFYVVSFGLSSLLVRSLVKVTGGKKSRKVYFYSAVIAFSPVLLLLLISFNALSIFTILLVGLFVALGCFVVRKRL